MLRAAKLQETMREIARQIDAYYSQIQIQPCKGDIYIEKDRYISLSLFSLSSLLSLPLFTFERLFATTRHEPCLGI
jgi:hypothetical protein